MIPKILHQIWLGKAPLPARWLDTWRELNPDFEYRLWREADVAELRLKRLRLFNAFYQRGLFSGCSDLVRAEILERFGGVYADADSECLRPVDELLTEDFFLVQEEKPAWPETLYNGCFMGSVPEHPILTTYGEMLGKVAAQPRPTRPTWQTVGPVPLTAAVMEHPGEARILPPWTFFNTTSSGLPVLAAGKPHPYGRHFFASVNGWASANYPIPFSILVAHREHPPGPRTRLWEFVRSQLVIAYPHAEIVEAEDDGIDPFNKCMALNRAAAKATTDLFAIWDSDTWVAPTETYKALQSLLNNPKQWAKPWHLKIKLNEKATETILESGTFGGHNIGTTVAGHRAVDLARNPENTNSYWAAPPFIITREAFDTVNGFDERIAGWGSEDAAFCWSLNTLWGPCIHQRIQYPAIHLFHPRLGKSGADAWPGQEVGHSNSEAYQLYRSLDGNPQAMAAHVAGNRSGRVVEARA